MQLAQEPQGFRAFQLFGVHPEVILVDVDEISLLISQRAFSISFDRDHMSRIHNCNGGKIICQTLQ